MHMRGCNHSLFNLCTSLACVHKSHTCTLQPTPLEPHRTANYLFISTGSVLQSTVHRYPRLPQDPRRIRRFNTWCIPTSTFPSPLFSRIFNLGVRASCTSTARAVQLDLLCKVYQTAFHTHPPNKNSAFQSVASPLQGTLVPVHNMLQAQSCCTK